MTGQRECGYERQKVVPAAGVEPATFRSGGERSNPLSYAGRRFEAEKIAQAEMVSLLRELSAFNRRSQADIQYRAR